MKKMILWWFLAIFITLSAAVYQRLTGPTHPKRISETIGENTYKFKLPRSESGTRDMPVQLDIPDTTISAQIVYRRYPTNEVWSKLDMFREGSQLVAFLPNQPPAGKIEYYIEIKKNENVTVISADDPVIARYKGEVPLWVLLPHIFFMFSAMLLSNLTGILAIARNAKQKVYGVITLIFLGIGGMFLGPVVQKFAFGEFWTGVPFGWDLTDNKTLIGFSFWLLAVLVNRKKPRYSITLLATIVLLLVYMIPHSAMGSELNHETGEVVTGFIRMFFWY